MTKDVSRKDAKVRKGTTKMEAEMGSQRTWCLVFAVVTALTLVTHSISGDPPAVTKEPPVVLGAEVLFYPPQAQAMGLSGQVIVEATTDGEKIVSTSANASNPFFIKPSIDNLKTWRFKSHSPRKFQVKYRYEIVHNTNPDAIDGNSHVIMNFPNEVCIRAQGVLLVHYKQSADTK